MTFDIEKSKAKRIAFTAVELHLDKNDPALDATFALEPDSYATPKTTDNPAAFTGVDFRVYRYSDQQLFGVNHFPGLVKATTNPPRIDPGKTIGFRATGTISLLDFDDNDEYALPSPYDDRRVKGSHATKLIERNHLTNRRAKIIRGYNPFNYSESDAQVENYLIDSFNPPDNNGKWSVNVVDELILVETKKSNAPTVSNGELTADMTQSQTNLSFVSSAPDEYGPVSSTGHIAIEKEIMSYTVDTATTMTVVRGIRSGSREHKTGETLQKCVAFEDENIIDVITQLITDYTKIPASYIPTADWAALKAGDLANYNLTNILFKPESVKKHLNDLIALAGLSMYVDVINQELVLVTAPDFATPVITFDEVEHLIQEKTKAKPNPKKQITRQTIHWNKPDITESNSEENYSKHFQVIDGIVEGDADESVVSEGKPLFSNWIINSLEDNSLATSFVQRTINRFSKTPLEVKGTIDQRYIDTVSGGRMWLGSIFNIDTTKIVDGGLNNVITTCQCVSLRPSSKDQQWDFVGLSYIAAAPPDADFYIDVDKEDYNLALDPVFSTILGDVREYTVVISSGVRISSSGSGILSFDQGVFPVGATLNLINLGQVLGRGGTGGAGGDIDDLPPVTYGTPINGLDGFDSMSFTTDTILDNGFGLIASGGGGAGGKFGAGFIAGQGGGGGAGDDGGLGGVGGNLIDLDTPPYFFGPSGVDGGSTFGGSPGGGELGQDGAANGAASGGSAGVAIQKNGNTVTIIAGNNSEQIKGAII